MTKFIAFGISFILGLVVATSLPGSASEADQLSSPQKPTLVSNELPTVEQTLCPCRGS